MRDDILQFPGGWALSREIVLSDVIRGRDELPQSIRLRVAFDALHDLPRDASLEPRSPGSRLRFENLRIDENGKARVTGEGDTSGAQVLLWEILASRGAPEGELPRVHDVVDEIHPDVDDLVARALALEGDPETIGELYALLEGAGEASAGDRDDVIVALALTPPKIEPPMPEEPARARVEPRQEAPAERLARLIQAAEAAAASIPPPPDAAASEPPPSPVETLSAPGVEAVVEPVEPSPSAAAPSSPPVAPVAAVAAAAVEEAAPDSMSGWDFLEKPAPVAPVPIANAAPVAAPPSSAPVSKPTAPDELPPSERSWGAVREDGRAITGMLRREGDPISQLPPLVLLVKHGEVDDGPLCHMLRAAGYGLMLRHDASSGYHAARQVLPDVVVVDFDLPDETGDRFVRRIRTDASRLAATPIILIAGADDTRSRIARFATGADVCLSKPFRFGDVVAQVAALVKMSARLRSAREALPYMSSTGDKVFQGDLSHISIGAMLTILEMERRTGVFDIRSEGRRAQLEIVAGRMTSGVALDRPIGPLATVRTVLRWGSGRFAFRTIPLRAPPPEAPSISEVLTEALRLQDEEDHDDVMPAKT